MSETPRRVLIVEDESIVALDLQSLLQRLSFDVCGRESTGEGAIERARQERPDLVLMDISLADEMDGITAAGEIRRFLDIPIIFLTAYADKTTVDRAKASDAYGYLLKPFQEREIEIAVDMALVKHRTQRKIRSQQALLDATLESIPDAVVTLDRERRIIYHNDQAMSLLGGGGEELLGSLFEERFPFLELPEEGALPGRRTVIEAPGGEHRYLELFCSEVESEEGARAVLLLRDITLRVEYEKRTEAARRAAEEASRAKSEFLANMSHELKTPMNSILGMSELALDLAEKEEQREYLSILRRAAEDLFDLITNLLDFSRLEAGRERGGRSSFRLDELLEEACQRQLPIALRKGNQLFVRIDPRIPLEVTSEREALASILTNLLSNGVKFTDNGRVTLEVSLIEEREGEAVLQFEVSDTGIGIPKEREASLFEAFTQADPSATRYYGGTGIGLALVRRLADHLGGKVCLRSAEGVGSTFTLTVTLTRNLDAPEPPLQEPLSDPPALVVWDDLSNPGEAILPWLATWGVTVERGATVDSLLGRENRKRTLLLLEAESFASERRQLTDLLSGQSVEAILLLGESEGVDLPPGVHPLGALPRLRHLKRIVSRPRSEEGDGSAPMNILVVDDEGIGRVATAGVLEALGHQVRTVGGGREALEALEQEMADVVFLDVEMPGLDGWQTAAAIRNELKRGRECAIIAVTGHSGDADRRRAKESGMDEFVTKPFLPRELDRVARRALTRRRYALRMQERNEAGGSAPGQEGDDPSQLLSLVREAVAAERFGEAEKLLVRLRERFSDGSQRDAIFRTLLACRRQDKESALLRLEAISSGGKER